MFDRESVSFPVVQGRFDHGFGGCNGSGTDEQWSIAAHGGRSDVADNHRGLMEKQHEYRSRLTWHGNLGTGTATYAGYSRDYTVSIDGKPDLHGSADPMFRGNPELPNPEDLFVAAISSCHMLSYLALCARKGIAVVAYEDEASGTLIFTGDGGGKFESVTLKPEVTIADAAHESTALALHEDAHRACYIASSCSTPVHHAATIRVADLMSPE